MSTSTPLAADTAMGAVTLNVADLDAMTSYYRDGVGLAVMEQTGPRVTLGRSGRPVVVLVHTPELRHAGPREAGLFHTAIVFDTEAALAAAVYSVARLRPASFTGSSDHLVSKAFYFDDPEGNGVELYWDRDRTTWSWIHGQVEMSTLFLDPNAYLREHLDERGLAGEAVGDARVGHIHLSVGDVATARDFYATTLGFDVTLALGDQAVFVSAGGYHHHMAMNVWNSRGAGRRQRTLGLGRVDLELPTSDDAGALAERLRHYRVPVRDDGGSVHFEDPWANDVSLTVAPSATS
ncbi:MULTISPECIES: VOC family protein [Microbacterium]|uniref:VOC family protein n=1 Tax=Microbacterium wangchenii TaxID=2541726 RepID=A0ABX5STI5_9MICO|nr:MULTISPECIES: VOC family protein [Microbacterium]MCK6067586.1 VOC family protein [Microbacterium sp. EYE_512]QBR89490.1 VOC family protein [Microbacterium wangchenii]TFV80838.1 VOC family protein [Microbacterium sp. dk485]TXK16912.1 VOC family protein [Microbacterium wangchenii]